MSQEIEHLLSMFGKDHRCGGDDPDIYLQYAALANTIAAGSANYETLNALRKLLESRDSAMRAAFI